MIDEDILKDFLAEAKYGIAKMEEEFIKLEKERENAEILKNLFRTVYALKEAAGFYGFKTLEKITHFAEDILAKLRDEVISADDEIIDVLLKCLKEIKYIVAYLEEHKSEPMEDRILEFLVELSNVNDKLKRIEKIKLMQEKEEVKEEATTVFEEILEKKITPSKEIIPNNDVLKEEKTEETEDLTPQIEFTDTYNKVDVKLLNFLVNLTSELILVKNRMIQLSNRLKDTELQRSVQALSKVTTELQETIMKTRMQPIAVIFNKFPKIVRDLARALNKKVNLHIEGTDTELDRFIIKAIKDPLIHLVRNAINHGIEPEEIRAQVGKPVEGNLYLRAYHNGGQVVIEIEDDGKGIDIEKIKRKALENGLISEEEAKKLTKNDILSFIFKSAFSRSEKVTQLSECSMGMDLVKTIIEKLGGSIEINTFLGKGTIVRIKIPLALTIIPALIVTSHGGRYAIPQTSIREVVTINEEKDILKIANTEFYRLRGKIVPVLRLSKVLNLEYNKTKEENLVILTTGDKYIGLLVDSIYDSEEIVVKPLGKWFKSIPLYRGATIMEDGKLALILDVESLSQFVGLKAEVIEKLREEIAIKTDLVETQFILIFQVGKEHLALPLALISRLEKIKAEDIKNIGGIEVILYKNQVVPIIRLENYLPIQSIPQQDEYNLLFFEEKKKTCAILCSNIVDAIETSLDINTDFYVQPGILGYKIINGKTVLFLDIYKILEMYDPEWFIVKTEKIGPVKILLAEDSPFFQLLISNYLIQAGFEVKIVENGKVALESLKSGFRPDIIISDIEMPIMDGFDFIKNVRATPEFKDIPILVLTSLLDEDVKRKCVELGANAYEVKFEREKVLSAINKLVEYKSAKNL